LRQKALGQEGKEEIVPKLLFVTRIIKLLTRKRGVRVWGVGKEPLSCLVVNFFYWDCLLPPSFDPVLEEVNRMQGILDQSLPCLFLYQFIQSS